MCKLIPCIFKQPSQIIVYTVHTQLPKLNLHTSSAQSHPTNACITDSSTCPHTRQFETFTTRFSFNFSIVGKIFERARQRKILTLGGTFRETKLYYYYYDQIMYFLMYIRNRTKEKWKDINHSNQRLIRQHFGSSGHIIITK